MKKLTFTFLLLLLSTSIFAQEPYPVACAPNAGTLLSNETFLQVNSTANDSIRILRKTYYNPIPGRSMVVITCISENGDLLWDKILGENAGSVSVSTHIASRDSGFFILGNYTDSMLIPGQDLIKKQGSNSFVAKLNSQGQFVWVKNNTFGRYLYLDASGKGVLLGQFMFEDYFDENDVRITGLTGTRYVQVDKFGPNGQHVYRKTFKGSYTDLTLRNLAEDQDGNLYLSNRGLLSSKVNVNGSIVDSKSSSRSDVVLIKLANDTDTTHSYVVFPEVLNGTSSSFTWNLLSSPSQGVVFAGVYVDTVQSGSILLLPRSPWGDPAIIFGMIDNNLMLKYVKTNSKLGTSTRVVNGFLENDNLAKFVLFDADYEDSLEGIPLMKESRSYMVNMSLSSGQIESILPAFQLDPASQFLIPGRGRAFYIRDTKDSCTNFADISHLPTIKYVSDGFLNIPNKKQNNNTLGVLYPNPCSHAFFLDLGANTNYEQISNLKIVDYSGRQLLQISSYNSAEGIEVSFLKSGIYFVSFTYQGIEKHFVLSKD